MLNILKTGIYCYSIFGLISAILAIWSLLCNEEILSFMKAKILNNFKETEK